MIQNISILNETKDRSYSSLVSRLSTLNDVSINEVKDIPALESHLKVQSIHVFILIVDRAPSELFLQTISKIRNRAGFRGAYFISIHKQFVDSGIQKALMAGAKTIYVEPIHQDRIAQEIQSYFHKSLPERSIAFSKIRPLPCWVEVFGRIGKMFFDSLGDLQIEIDAKLFPGQSVKVRSLIAKDQGFAEFDYSIESATADDNYYNYANSYHLRWQALPLIKKNLSKWVEKNEKNFALPKTKVLWIRETPLGAMENTLNKTLFSLHTQTQEGLTYDYLQRLNPKILISDPLPKNLLQSVQSWMDGRKGNQIILISTQPERPEHWHHIPATDASAFSMAFIPLMKSYMYDRISTSTHHARYFDRKSNYSRFSLPLDGHVVSIEKSHVLLELKTELEPNTIFYTTFFPFQGKSRLVLYLKVLKTEPLPQSSGFLLTCGIVPISDQPERFLREWSSWIQALTTTENKNNLKEMTSKSVGQSTPIVPPKLFFLESKLSARISEIGPNPGKILLVCVVTGVLLLCIYHFQSKPQSSGAVVTEETYELMATPMQKAFRSIRDAFK